MTKVTEKFTVEELTAFDDDCYPGEVTGYWCEGHIDPQQFAIACNQEFDLAGNDSPMHSSEPKHGYFKKQFEADGEPLGDGQYLLVNCKAENQGAIAATFVMY